MTQSFKEQMDIAREILGKLSVITPRVVVAGGAPRDWYDGKLCNDIDIYMNIPDHDTIDGTRARLETCLGIEGVKTFSELKKSLSNTDLAGVYHGVSRIKRIWQFDYKGITVQIMYMDIEFLNPFKVIDTFQNSLCEYYLSNALHNPNIGMSDAAKLTRETCIAFITEEYRGKKHHRKMQDRYGSKYTYLDSKYLPGILYARQYGISK